MTKSDSLVRYAGGGTVHRECIHRREAEKTKAAKFRGFGVMWVELKGEKES